MLRPVLGAALSQQQLIELQGDLFELLFDPKDCAQLLGLFEKLPPLNARYNSLGETAPLLVAAAMGVLSGGSATISFGGVAASLDDTYFPGLNFGGPAFAQLPGAARYSGQPSVIAARPAIHRTASTRSARHAGRAGPAALPIARGVGAASHPLPPAWRVWSPSLRWPLTKF